MKVPMIIGGCSRSQRLKRMTCGTNREKNNINDDDANQNKSLQKQAQQGQAKKETGQRRGTSVQ